MLTGHEPLAKRAEYTVLRRSKGERWRLVSSCQLAIIRFLRWDEKAGLQRDAVRSQ